MIDNPIYEGKTPDEIARIKSVWIEASPQMDDTFIFIFTKRGILNNHEFITDCHKVDKKELFQKILDADQICFNSSVVKGESVDLIISLIEKLIEIGTIGKTFISGGYLLRALNDRVTIPDSERLINFFLHNRVYELDNSGFKRIIGNKYQFISYYYEQSQNN